MGNTAAGNPARVDYNLENSEQTYFTDNAVKANFENFYTSYDDLTNSLEIDC